MKVRSLFELPTFCLLLAFLCSSARATITVTTTNDSGAGSLRAAILGSAATDTINFSVTGTINLATPLPMITNNLTIDGPGASLLTISGGGSNRVFFVDASNESVNFSGLTISNGWAQGGNGGTGFSAGGGGLGAGGAIFVNAGAVTVSNVVFGGNAAVGGTGGNGVQNQGGGGGGGFGGSGGAGNFSSGGGGGGFGGNGGSVIGDGGGGGGGLIGNGGNGSISVAGAYGNGGGGGAIGAGQNASSTNAGAGGTGGGGTGGANTSGSGNSAGANGLLNGGGGGGGYGTALGGFSGGNGGNGGKFGGGGGADETANGGNGGDFGGGGGCAAESGTPGNGGNGGFGGGGGGISNNGGGVGGFGGGGGGKSCTAVSGGNSLAFGGQGGAGGDCGADLGSGGGGAALGGAVFVRGNNGATLTWIDSTADAGTLIPGAGGPAKSTASGSVAAASGQTAGSVLFLMGSSNVLSILSGQQTISGSIGGWSGSPGSLTKQGAGTLVLSATNTFPGATFVNAGGLEIDGSYSSTNLEVNAGATLTGIGTVGGLTINPGSTFSPGSGIGKLSAGNTFWSGAGNYNWQLYDAAGAAGTGYDVLSINGTLNLSNASGFNINLWTLSSPSPLTSGNAINFTNTEPVSWTLVQTTGGIAGFNPGNFVINTGPVNGAGGFANALGNGHFVLSVVGNNLVLTYATPDSVTVQPASALTGTTATLNGTVTPGGLSTTWYFEYGTTPSYGNTTATNTLGSISNPLPVASTISGLTPNTLYHFNLVASNSTGIISGTDTTFTTPVLVPAVITEAATSITATSATLNGSVNPGDGITSFYFQYGTTTNYGTFTPTGTLAAGMNTVVTNAIVTVNPGTLYHFAIVASNAAGLGIGSDQSFTTPTLSNLTVTTTNDSGLGSLRQAILGAAPTATINFAVTGTITLASPLPMITNNLTIDGPGASLLTISGGGSNRVFFVDASNESVNFSGLTISNGWAQGGNGGNGFSAGGGGLGAGGAIFVNAGAVTVSNVVFGGNAAVGGTGGNGVQNQGGGGGGGFGGSGGAGNFSSGGGGGGFGGNGGSVTGDGGGGGGGLIGNGGNGSAGESGAYGSGGGGGGIGAGQNASNSMGGAGGAGGGGTGGTNNFGTAGAQGANGLLNGGGGGGGYGSSGGYGGGNGGNGGKFGGGGGADETANGGNGGDFGGGGGCAAESGTPGNGGDGGFGGGGGGISNNGGGVGGFGGGGGGKSCTAVSGGNSLAFGGQGGAGGDCGADLGSGGGGAALGGAVFVRGNNGATLTWIDSTADAGTLIPGAGGPTTSIRLGSVAAASGQTAGSALFLMGSSNVFSISSGQQTISGSIGGWSGSPGSLIKQGAGTLVLSATNTFPGATFVNAGILQINGNHSSSSNLVVNAGGTLSGAGTVGVLTINAGGTLSPAATQMNASNTFWSGAGNYNWQLYDAAGAAGTGYDVLSINGTLDVSAASGFNINLSTLSSLSPVTNGNAINFTNTQSTSWTLVQTTGGIVGFNPANFNVNTGPANGTAGFSNSLGTGHFTLSVVGNNLILTFVVPPSVTVQPATALSSSSATLNGTVTPAGLTTTWYFEYGRTVSYGSNTTTNTLGSTNNPLSVASSISGLTPGTLYHFNLVASNSGGIVSGSDTTFTTPPVVVSPAILQQPVMLPNGAFSFTFTNAPGASFTAWAAQDVSLALSNWTLVGPAQEVSPGQYQFTDAQATNFVQRFYIIRSP